MIVKIVGMLAITLIAGCSSDTHRITDSDGETGFHFATKESIYISVPKSGSYGNENYTNSGSQTAEIINSAFVRHTRYTTLGRRYSDFRSALQAAKDNNSDYLVFPTILHWEDRATEWSMISDKIEIKIEIVDTASEKTVSSVVINGKSGLATFGGDHPQDLLPEPIEKYVSSLY